MITKQGFTVTDQGISRVHNWLLLLVLAGAAFLRLLYIDQPFVDLISWRQADDATIADSFFRGHLNIFLPEVSWSGPGPSYVGYEFQLSTYLAALLYHLFGHADWIGRGISVLFGVWGIFALYKLVLCAFNELRALLTCAVFAAIPGAIFVERSFIPDPIMVSLVITSFWMLLVYLQNRRARYLSLAVISGALGIMTKISGLIVGLPAVYVIYKLLPADRLMRSRFFIRMMIASTLMLAPVIGYYAWAVHVSHTYPPYWVAAGGNWVWDVGFESWLKTGYFWRPLLYDAWWLWCAPLLALALVGLLFPPQSQAEANCGGFSIGGCWRA